MTKPMWSELALRARVAGYAHRVYGSSSGQADDTAAFQMWLEQHQPDDTSVLSLLLMWHIGMSDYDPHATQPQASPWLTVLEAAKASNVTPATIYAILKDDDRRRAIFPHATHDGQGWLLHADDVARYRPVRGRGRRAKGNG